MSGVVWGATRVLATTGWSQRWTDLAAVCVVIPLGAAAYGGLLWLLRIEGREEIEQLLRDRLGWRTRARDESS
jgi:putative peptidoglycan lipid II flippase